jgi:hypothetical protein
MQLMGHSRLLVLLFVSLACVALNFWLISTGHYRLPLFVFVGAIALITLTFRNLPPSAKNSEQINGNLLKASSAFRRLGFIGAFGIAVYTLTASRDDFKGFPTWGIVLLYLWGGLVVWCCFWAARWYKRTANASPVNTKQRDAE